MQMDVVNKIIENGVNNLKEYGYPDATAENIFTDFVYAQMFLSMLNNNLGLGYDKEINHLIGKVQIDQQV